MRVAICLSGQIRNWKLAYKNQLYFWSRGGNVIDYFIHTWDYSADRTGVSKPYIERDVTIDEFNEVKNAFNPIKYEIDNKKQYYFYDNDHWSSLFYSFSRSIMMKRKYEIENGFEYDVVVKSRPDVCFNPNFFHSLDKINNNIIRTTHGGPMPLEFNMFNINDCVFMGNSYTMDLLINLYFYRQQKINKNIPNSRNYHIMGPGVLMHEYFRDFGITPLVDLPFHEILIKGGCPTDLDLLNVDDFNKMESYFRNWYNN